MSKRTSIPLLLCIALAGVLPAMESARAQSFDNAALASRLTEFARTRQFNAAQYESLSRLIPSPNEQINWLSNSAVNRSEAGDRELARGIIARADARVQTWRTRGVPLDEAIEQAVGQLIATLTPIFEVTNPSKLLERLRRTRPEEIQSLDAVAKFILYARGVGEPLLPAEPAAPDDFARSAAEGLAAEANTLPTISKLLDWWNRVNSEPAPTGGPDDSLRLSTEVAAALVARALGLDGADRLRPNDDASEHWAAYAQTLELHNLWRWATLARLLQASTALTADDRRLAAIEGKKSWALLQQVSPNAWPAVSRWLDRLDREDSGELEIPGRLPLSVEFRDRGRQQRESYEQQFLTALGRGDNEGAFRFMQLAKAADLTLLGAVPPPAGELTIETLKRYFGRADNETGEIVPSEVHLYLEILELTSTAAGPGRLYGFVLRDETTGMLRGDRYVTEWIQGADSPQALVQQAVQWMPAGFKGGRMIIAPDGRCRTAAWLDAEPLLTARVTPTDPRSWMVYAPSAAALQQKSPWEIDAAIRAWNLSIVRSGATAAGGAGASGAGSAGTAFTPAPFTVITDRPGGAPFAKEISPIRSTETQLTVFQLDKSYSVRLRQKPPGKDWNYYPQHLISMKDKEAARTLAVIVSRP